MYLFNPDTQYFNMHYYCIITSFYSKYGEDLLQHFIFTFEVCPNICIYLIPNGFSHNINTDTVYN